ncbi:MAG: hypothetical protein J4431_02180 [Candidatus Aenigmarchaeota archaeon]|nr:hypothetical protein [Candidatus Aenigmarchaeota archaeon]
MKKPFIAVFFALALYLMLSFGGEAAIHAAAGGAAAPGLNESGKNASLGSMISVVTKNGMTLEKGAVRNNGNGTIAINSVTIGGSKINVSMRLGPGEFAQYAIVGGFIIMPQGYSVINEKETSYFPSSEKLSIRLSSGSPESIVVVIPKSAAPLLVKSSSNIRWALDRETSRILISSDAGGIGNNTEIYFGRASHGQVFIEDTEKAETLQYRNLNAAAVLEKSNATLTRLLENETSLEDAIAQSNALLADAADSLAAGESAIAESSIKLSEARLKAAATREFRPEMLAFMLLLAGATIYVTFIRRDTK